MRKFLAAMGIFAFLSLSSIMLVEAHDHHPDPAPSTPSVTTTTAPTPTAATIPTTTTPPAKTPNKDGSTTFGSYEPLRLQVAFPGQEGNTVISDKGKGAIGILEEYISQVYVFGSGLVSLVAVLWIIVGGYEIMFSSSGGDMSGGKEKIIQSLMGLCLVFLSGLILYTINPGFFTW